MNTIRLSLYCKGATLAVLLILTLMPFGESRGQNTDYVRKVVATLASPEMKGRGYVGGGDSIAASYIAGEYQRIGIKAIGDSYYQDFKVNVNTHPGELSLRINGVLLKPGRDYLLEGGSPTRAGRFETVSLRKSDLQMGDTWVSKVRGISNRVLMITEDALPDIDKVQKAKVDGILKVLKYNEQVASAGVVIFTKDKLVHSPSPTLYPRPVFVVNRPIDPDTVREVSFSVESIYRPGYPTRNVVGFLPGTAVPDTMIMITAHYDHLGMMGRNTYFPGANDNASGVAMMLDLARYFAANRPRYSVMFVAFAAEELGLGGSRHYVINPMYPLNRVKFLLNLDLEGTGDEGIQVVNATVHQNEFKRLFAINMREGYLAQIKPRGEACNSDHCFFHQAGVKSFYIYTLGGAQAYHDIDDVPANLSLADYPDYFRLLTTFFEEMR